MFTDIYDRLMNPHTQIDMCVYTCALYTNEYRCIYSYPCHYLRDAVMVMGLYTIKFLQRWIVHKMPSY